MAEKRPNGTDIDAWTFSQLQYLVEEYKIFTKPTLDAKQIAKLDQQNKQAPSQAVKNQSHNQTGLLDNFYQQRNPYSNQGNQSWSKQNLNYEFEEPKYQQSLKHKIHEPLGIKIVKTASIVMPTVLSNHNYLHHGISKTAINFKVCDVHQYQSKYYSYRIQTPAPFHWDVRRSDMDFQRLHQHLFNSYPHILIPPIPGSGSKIKIELRCNIYERFLRDLMHAQDSSAEIIRADKFVYEFLSTSSESFSKQTPETRLVQSVKDLVTVDGQINVYNYQSMQAECELLQQYIKQFESGYMQAYQLFNEMQADFDNVCFTLTRLQSSFESLSHLHSHAPWHVQVNNPETFYYYQQNAQESSRGSEKLAQTHHHFSQTFHSLAKSYADQEQNPLLSSQTQTFFQYYSLVGESLQNHYNHHIKQLQQKLLSAQQHGLPETRLQELQDLFSVIVWSLREAIKDLEEKLYERDFKSLQSLFKLKLVGQV